MKRNRPTEIEAWVVLEPSGAVMWNTFRPDAPGAKQFSELAATQYTGVDTEKQRDRGYCCVPVTIRFKEHP